MGCARTARAAAALRTSAERPAAEALRLAAIRRSFAGPGDGVGDIALQLQSRDQRTHRDAAVRQRVLAFERKLGAGKPALHILEVRVVAEAARSARLVDDDAVPAPLGDDRLRIVRTTHEHERAVVMRAAVTSTAKRVDELRVVARIRLRLAGIARALDAGSATERRHA